jgi:heme-degrading monooxygenase HmoA
MEPDTIAELPEPPYYAVIFTSRRHDPSPDDGYTETAARMLELVREQPGFLGAEIARSGVGITVAYFRDEESIAAWKHHADHAAAQATGRERWYDQYATRVAKVERAYGFTRGAPTAGS